MCLLLVQEHLQNLQPAYIDRLAKPALTFPTAMLSLLLCNEFTIFAQVHTGFLARAMDATSEPFSCEQFEVYHAALSTAFRRDDDFAGSSPCAVYM